MTDLDPLGPSGLPDLLLLAFLAYFAVAFLASSAVIAGAVLADRIRGRREGRS